MISFSSSSGGGQGCRVGRGLGWHDFARRRLGAVGPREKEAAKETGAEDVAKGREEDVLEHWEKAKLASGDLGR